MDSDGLQVAKFTMISYSRISARVQLKCLRESGYK